MKVYFLNRLGELEYDVAEGFIVLADSEKEARALASRQHGDEGPATWTSSKLSTCEEVRLSGEPRVLLRDFYAG